MITNQSYLTIAGKIAASFCQNEVCKNATYERLKNNLDNDSFSFLLENLNRGSIIIVKITKIVLNRSGKVQVDWSWLDVIRGSSGSYSKAIPPDQITNYVKFGNSVLGMVFVKELIDLLNQKILVYHNLNSPGYGIALTNDPESTGGGSYNSGEDVRIDPIKSGGSSNTTSSPVQSLPGVYSGSNYSNYILPAAVLAGVYLLMKK